jgi:hypothetical protein
MDDTEFDRALITAAFTEIGLHGWAKFDLAGTASAAGLPLDRVRGRFPTRAAVLLGFGRLADQAALTTAATDGPPRDRLFDLLMHRFDVLQAHRDGVRAILRALPGEPMLALLLAESTRKSMGWMLAAAGVPPLGLIGALREKGLVAVWLYTVRAWESDDSADLSATMAALDRALDRAAQVATWLEQGPGHVSAPKPFPEVDAP